MYVIYSLKAFFPFTQPSGDSLTLVIKYLCLQSPSQTQPYSEWIMDSVLFSYISSRWGKNLSPSSSIEDEESEAIEDVHKIGTC